MTRISFCILLILGMSASSSAQLGNLVGKAKSVLGGDDSKVGDGLKEALNIGVNEAVSALSAADGYYGSPYRILLPEEAKSVISKVKMVPGFENIESDIIKKMNEAAELAAKKAGPIFLNAIKQMTFQDAMNILVGNTDAATRYLEGTSRKALYAEFMPVIRGALDEVKARELWSGAVTAYNKIPLVKKMNPALDDHVNNKALDGMFSLVEKKEEGIRKDTGLRTSPLLKEVFARQDKK